VVSERIVRNIEAVVVLAAAIAASLFVPSETLVPAAALVLVVSIAGVFSVRVWVEQLRYRAFPARRALLAEVGVVLAMAGLAAFIVLLVEFAD